jgi:cellulose synthase/poly-beta-1,6-N-acetylglucosamine synthase-like glycosyltransferase
MGYKIRMIPQAVTWEQEPFKVSIWFKQRTRWAMGNIYVLVTNFRYVFDKTAGSMRLDIVYYLLLYVLMLSALVFSDTIFPLSILGFSHVSLGGLSTLVWVLASALFTLNICITIATEKNEFTAASIFLIVLMLFTYCKLWVFVTAKALYMSIKQAVTKTETKWYKTERSAD